MSSEDTATWQGKGCAKAEAEARTTHDFITHVQRAVCAALCDVQCREEPHRVSAGEAARGTAAGSLDLTGEGTVREMRHRSFQMLGFLMASIQER